MSYRPLVKICGVRTPAMLEAVIAAGADMVGFIHFQRSPRHVEIDPLAGLISQARGRVETCVLLVNPDNSCVVEVAALGPNWLQLHGPETPHRVEAIKAESGLAIMKALAIGAAGDVAQIDEHMDVADRILLDAKPPKGADRPGGHGVPFDWTVLNGLSGKVGYMLSGGLTPDNVTRAIAIAHPLGVDVSSGVEKKLGEKDAGLIATFVAAVRSAAQPD